MKILKSTSNILSWIGSERRKCLLLLLSYLLRWWPWRCRAPLLNLSETPSRRLIFSSTTRAALTGCGRLLLRHRRKLDIETSQTRHCCQ